MATTKIIDNVFFEGKHKGLRLVDFLFTLHRIALGGRKITVEAGKSRVEERINNLAIRILCGLFAFTVGLPLFALLLFKCCCLSSQQKKIAELTKKELKPEKELKPDPQPTKNTATPPTAASPARAPAAAASKSPWEKKWDENYNCHYYFNSATGESSWEAPLGFTESTPKPLPRNWSLKRTDDGNPYYYNSATNESQWEAPIAAIASEHEAKGKAAVSVLIPKPCNNIPIPTSSFPKSIWVKMWSPQAEKYFYYNTDTKQSGWKAPADFQDMHAKSLPKGWQLHYTEKGNLFYHNSATKESRWVHPSD